MISVIIPTYNEASHIKTTIQKLYEYDTARLIKEIIVVDGGSQDNTRKVAATEKAKVVLSPKKGRAAQMNVGAQQASGEVFYFLHADTLPPKGFTQDIKNAVEKGRGAGCYMLSFDCKHWFLRVNCWFTRFNVDAVRFGDQSLFVTKNKFKEVGGFCEKHTVLEDQHIIKRLKKICSFTIVKKSVLTSARKYQENGIYKTQAIFFVIYFLYQMGVSQEKLVATYRKLISQDKI